MSRRLLLIALAVVIASVSLDRLGMTWVSEARAETVVLANGSFRDADARHKGSGDATLISEGGGHVIRLTNFKVTPGPDLILVVSSHPDPRNKNQVQEGFLDLGKLQGAEGDYDYKLPAGADAGAIKSVIVYCRAFSVIFAVAPLQ